MSHQSPPLYGSVDGEAAQREAFAAGEFPVAVYGLGKIGLPLAAVFAEATGAVTGVDVDPAVVDRINEGESPVDNEPYLDTFVGVLVGEGALRATLDARAAAADARLHVVVVPTRLDASRDPDLSAVESALEPIAAGLDPGDLVVVESTVPPGTAAGVVEPTLADASGLRDDSFGVAFCPERTSSGRAIRDISGAYPKIVGGTDDEATRAAALVYDELTTNRVIETADATTAECVKLFEGVYRDVNIALANELARFTDEFGVSANAAISAANTQPFCDIHRPGVGVGGHCIPYYPHFLMASVSADTPLIRTARWVNHTMPEFTVERLARRLDDRGRPLETARIAVLGVAYRPGVAEKSESPGLAVAEQLIRRGADVVAVDPYVDVDVERDLDVEVEATVGGGGRSPAFSTARLSELAGMGLDGVVVATAHPEFTTIEWDRFDDLLVIDGRGLPGLENVAHEVVTIGGREPPRSLDETDADATTDADDGGWTDVS